MKELLLIRHAKASWDYPELDDHDRPLKKRGIHDAENMAHELVNRNLLPELVLVSSAARTIETAEILFGSTKIERKIVPEIYESHWSDNESILQDQDDSYTRISFVGHNPAFTHLIQLTGCSLDDLPPCGIALIRWECDHWNECSFKNGETVTILIPKEFR